MSQPDMTELRELRERLTVLSAEYAVLLEQHRDARLTIRDQETQIQRMTDHVNRLLAEKAAVWGAVTGGDPEC